MYALPVKDMICMGQLDLPWWELGGSAEMPKNSHGRPDKIVSRVPAAITVGLSSSSSSCCRCSLPLMEWSFAGGGAGGPVLACCRIGWASGQGVAVGLLSPTPVSCRRRSLRRSLHRPHQQLVSFNLSWQDQALIPRRARVGLKKKKKRGGIR